MSSITIGADITLDPNKSSGDVCLNLKMANRHGVIAGATGTGKTVSLQLLAESFSSAGVPVFTADIKGDLSGIAKEGHENSEIQRRIAYFEGKAFTPARKPVSFWDLYGKKGLPVRATVSEIGPILLARLLDLNETQEDILQIAFKIADDEGLLLLDLKDLVSIVQYIEESRSELSKNYGNIASTSIGAIKRKLIAIEQDGANLFFGEPALKIENIMQKDFSGMGVISCLDATELMKSPNLYAYFLLWLLSELFEELPEVGDMDKPKLVFFFDEAHLLFREAPKVLIEKIETVVRLIRSKGVGVFFVTQEVSDIPERVLAQLGNRIQHGLRAFTPKQKESLKVVAKTFRENTNFDTIEAISNLGVGEAVVSVLEEDGTPSIAKKVLICPPSSKIGPIEDDLRKEIINSSPFKALYENSVDRESAYELLTKRRQELEQQRKSQEEKEKAEKEAEKEAKAKSRRQSPVEAFFKSILRSVGSSVGRKIARGILGSILK